MGQIPGVWYYPYVSSLMKNGHTLSFKWDVAYGVKRYFQGGGEEESLHSFQIGSHLLC